LFHKNVRPAGDREQGKGEKSPLPKTEYIIADGEIELVTKRVGGETEGERGGKKREKRGGSRKQVRSPAEKGN